MTNEPLTDDRLAEIERNPMRADVGDVGAMAREIASLLAEKQDGRARILVDNDVCRIITREFQSLALDVDQGKLVLCDCEAIENKISSVDCAAIVRAGLAAIVAEIEP